MTQLSVERVRVRVLMPWNPDKRAGQDLRVAMTCYTPGLKAWSLSAMQDLTSDSAHVAVLCFSTLHTLKLWPPKSSRPPATDTPSSVGSFTFVYSCSSYFCDHMC